MTNTSKLLDMAVEFRDLARRADLLALSADTERRARFLLMASREFEQLAAALERRSSSN